MGMSPQKQLFEQLRLVKHLGFRRKPENWHPCLTLGIGTDHQCFMNDLLQDLKDLSQIQLSRNSIAY